MSYQPETSYDAEHKIWSGPVERFHFAPDLSIGEIIFHEMRRHPKQVAQVSATEHTLLTRSELHQNSMRVASYMRQIGLRQSDIVGIMARNSTHIAAVAYACFFNGIAFHALHVVYEKDTIRKLFSITAPKIIFCDGDEYEKLKEATASLNTQIVTMRNHPPGVTKIEDLLNTPIEPNFEPARLEQGVQQTLAILCSSGTTGTPKAVTITNSQKMINSSNLLTTADVQYSHSTFDWLSGLGALVTSGVFSTKRIIADNTFDPAILLRIIEEYKVTWLLQPPSHMAMLVNCPEFEEADLSSLRYYLYGGGRCSVEVQETVRSRLDHDCLHFSYGCTELGTIATMNRNYDAKPNSVGRLLPGFKIKILNDEGKALGPDEVGEVCVTNGQYWAGYYGNPEESHKIRDANLWFHTGDLGYMDEDGFLFIVERKKEMLKYQNIIYYPNEVEEVIAKMPGVSEVCVFGVWNQFNGDEAAAAVVKKFGADFHAQDVVDYVADHVDAKYKQLNAGAIIMDDLARSANGKTNRNATKAYFLEAKDRS
ncbi:4-coumarate--CoA ligase 1-like isoform X1 [Scaptodrosophila lebanonensis]|uniref:4-coumarate--CoA ligase 1-like isoform X1 n=1 Tax=Drosophila lebanonensis TaxID=7225 RepID=A0A6J2TG72_DROLE|nr:4-coumarate--CoA ligase 1-like isoform X1 [Scaptodrosophila lebanonensis]